MVKIYDDKKPFDKKQEIALNFETHNAIVSLDRRSAEKQTENRFVIVALRNATQGNYYLTYKLVKF